MKVIVFSKENSAKAAFAELPLPDTEFVFVSYPLELETKLNQSKYDLYILFTGEFNVNEVFYTGKVLGRGLPVLVVADSITLLAFSLYTSTCLTAQFLEYPQEAIQKAVK